MVDSEKSSTFLTRLYSVLELPHVEYMIHWNQDGSGIVIKHPDEFSVLTLPSITGRSRFSDFVRQLDMYGFVRHVNNEQDIGDHDRDAGVWSHPKLRRQTTRDVVAAVTRRIVNRLPKPTQKQDSQEHISMTRSGAIYSSATDAAQTAIPDDGNDLPSESLLKELKFRDLADTFTPTEYKKIAQCYLNEGSDCWKTICTKTAFRTRTHQLEELCKRLESLYTEKWLQLKDIPIDALDNLTAENAHSIISTIARRDRAKSKTEVQAAPEFAGTSTQRIGEKRCWEESSDDDNDYRRYLSQFKEQKGLPKKKSNNSSDSPSLASGIHIVGFSLQLGR
ncbi:winged helix DNA-binding domain-containing protein [Pholiota conissans]|uniref:Winged helix DNA-binding domain-containing protein n=1 Tax=Pholiota conissans TaxID=109636 RepID=A0A9P5Z1J3_9AGAR|nr:winged helix DNA-binding domain-containing protein [Pholiota conissans]